MKNKTEAAKILLDNGWTFEEIQDVLGESKAMPFYPTQPTYNPYKFWWGIPSTTSPFINWTINSTRTIEN